MTRPGIAQKRFSMHRFHQIPEAVDEPEHPMDTPNEVTIDIPLSDDHDHSQSQSQSGSHSQYDSKSQTESHSSEKQGQGQRKSHESRRDQDVDDEPHRGMDSISLFNQYRCLPDDGDAGGNNNNNSSSSNNNQNPNISEKAHLVPDCDASSTGRRRRARNRRSNGIDDDDDDDGFRRSGDVNFLGRVYRAVRNSSLLVRYFIYITPIAVLLAIPIIVGSTVARYATIGGVAMYWFFAWLEVVWFSLWVSKILARGLPVMFQSLCGIVSPGTRKYALMLRALEIPISLVGWTLISLVTFFPMMAFNPRQKYNHDSELKSWEKSVKNILFGLFVCSLILLTEKTLILFVSINYHRKQFDSRIKDSKRNVHLLSVLYDASRTMFPMYCKEFQEEDAVISDSMLAAAAVSSNSLFKGRAGILRSAGRNMSRFGDRVTEMVGSVAQELTGKHVFNPTAAHSIVTQALERTKSSEALARRIWMSYVVEGREALYLEDIIEVLGGGREAESEDCFHILDRDGNGDISLDEMVLTVSELGRMRQSLHHSLHDVDQAIQVLDQLLLTIAAMVGVLVFVSFVTTGFGTVIAAGATSLFSLSFIFSTTAQEVLGSCVFIFVKHPFDVGDRVDIDARPYIVERISLLFTIFRCVSDHRITQVPNAVLNTLWIDNLTRATAMHEHLAVSVSFGTTIAHIQSLREEMEFFVRDKENCRDFQPDLDVEVVGLGDDTDRLQLRVDLRHKSNWANESVRAARRSKFMAALVMAMRKLQVRGPGDTPLPGYVEPTPAPSISTEDRSTSSEDRNTQAQGQSTAHLMVPDHLSQGGSNQHDHQHQHHSSDSSNSSGASSSTSTPGKTSLCRRNATAGGAAPASAPAAGRGVGQQPRAPTTTTEEESNTADTGEADDAYQTPATSPERRKTSLRYHASTSTTGSAHPRSRQALLVRGLSTGHRNRRMSTILPPPLYHGYGGSGTAGLGGGGGSSSNSGAPVYQPYPGPASSSGSGSGSGSATLSVGGSAGSAAGPGNSDGNGGSPVSPQHRSGGQHTSSGDELQPQPQQQQQYQAYDASAAPPAYDVDSQGQQQDNNGSGPSDGQDQSQSQSHTEQGQERSGSPSSPGSRSNKSRAGSDEQGIGKPRGPRN